MLLSAIGLWALNLTVSRYILTHGFQPLAYSTVRYGLAAARLHRHRPRRRAVAADRASRPRCWSLAAAVALWVNQIGFVYALKTTSASVIALILAATPIFAALIGLALRHRGAAAALLARRGAVVRRRRARRARSGRRAGRRPRRDPARHPHRRDLGRLLDPDHAADAAVLAVADQRGRAVALVGRDRADRPAADALAGLAARLGGLGAARLRDARPARDHERALVPVARPDRRLARDARDEPAAVRRRPLRGRAARRADRRCADRSAAC